MFQPSFSRTAISGLALVLGFAVLALLYPPALLRVATVTDRLLDGIGSSILWFSTGLLLLAILLAISPWGRLRLGQPDERPRFGTLSWLAMLFAAGMGSGLVFWGVAEPLTHLSSFPEMSAATALALTYFHWGPHAWAIYAFAGLTVAWFGYRQGRSTTTGAPITALFEARIGKQHAQTLGKSANLLAILAVVFGVAGSLANGINLLGTGAESSTGFRYGALGLLTLCFMLSAWSGLRKGIRIISLFNVMLAMVVMVYLLLVSDISLLSRLLMDSSVEFFRRLPGWSTTLIDNPYNAAWARGWTLTYLVWWIAWTPFVGVFIARISRGRTIRAFLLAVIGVPTLVSILWFGILGGAAIGFDSANQATLSSALEVNYSKPLFAWLDALPFGSITPWLIMLLLFVFLVTSADSAAYVLAMLSGRQDDSAPARHLRILWGLATALVAAGLIARNDVDLNKAVAIAGALPFIVILLLQIAALLRSLSARRHRATVALSE